MTTTMTTMNGQQLANLWKEMVDKKKEENGYKSISQYNLVEKWLVPLMVKGEINPQNFEATQLFFENALQQKQITNTKYYLGIKYLAVFVGEKLDKKKGSLHCKYLGWKSELDSKIRAEK